MERLPAWIAITIIVREFLITGLRVVALSKDIVIPAEIGGKIKTTIQIIAILCLILTQSVLNIDIYGFGLYDIGVVLIWAALFLSIVSGIKYTISFGKKI